MQAQHTSEKKFRTLLDEVSDPIFTISPDGHYGYVNLAFAAGIGRNRDDIIGKTIWDIFDKDEANKRFVSVQWVFENREPKLIEVCVPGADGNRHYLTTVKPILDADNQVDHVLCISKEITERKQVERQLIESEERLEMALEGAGLGLWDYDVRSGYGFYDQRWCMMLGYQMDEVGNDMDGWERLIHPDDWPNVQAEVELHLSGGSARYESEHRLRHKDGHWVWVLSRGRIVMRDPQGNPQRVAGTHLDISNQKRLSHEGAHLLQSIESLMRGATVWPGTQSTTPRLSQTKTADCLSRRQRQILGLIATGRTSSEIAAQLKIGKATAVTHRREMMRKLNLHTVAELTRYAIQEGLIPG